MFVWKSRAKPSNTGVAKVNPQNDAEYILCYGKGSTTAFRLVTSGKDRSYPHQDKDGNYRLQTILKSNRGENKRETMTFELNGYKPPATKRWQAGEETIKHPHVPGLPPRRDDPLGRRTAARGVRPQHSR